jgi:hypothetical protein
LFAGSVSTVVDFVVVGVVAVGGAYDAVTCVGGGGFEVGHLNSSVTALPSPSPFGFVSHEVPFCSVGVGDW